MDDSTRRPHSVLPGYTAALEAGCAAFLKACRSHEPERVVRASAEQAARDAYQRTVPNASDENLSRVGPEVFRTIAMLYPGDEQVGRDADFTSEEEVPGPPDVSRWKEVRDVLGHARESQPASQPRGTRRVNVNFSEQAYDTLEQIARQTGKSMSDVLRDAIALKAWFEQTRAEGGHVLVERPDGKTREVISV